MDYEQYRLAAYLVVIMFGAAFNARFLGASIVAGLAMVALANNVAGASFVFLFYLASLIVSGFRE